MQKCTVKFYELASRVIPGEPISPCGENKPKSGNFGNSSMDYEKVPPVQNRLLKNMWIS